MEETLGEGTFGAVKQAFHKASKSKVAIKILSKADLRDDEAFERLKREVEVSKTVNHPNVCALLNVFHSHNSVYLVQELAGSTNLLELVQSKGKLTEEQTCPIISQIVAGLHYLQSKNISHRDLKAENIVLSSSNAAKIVDFGFSKINENMHKTACGSLFYASPELVRGDRYRGDRNDIWNLGIIIFYCVAGFYPFNERSDSRMFEKIKRCELEYPGFFSNDLIKLLKSIFRPDPSKRAGVKQIRNSIWLRNKPNLKGIDCYLDESVVREVSEVAQVREETVKSVLESEMLSEIRVSYFCLKKRKQPIPKPKIKINSRMKSVDYNQTTKYAETIQLSPIKRVIRFSHRRVLSEAAERSTRPTTLPPIKQAVKPVLGSVTAVDLSCISCLTRSALRAKLKKAFSQLESSLIETRNTKKDKWELKFKFTVISIEIVDLQENMRYLKILRVKGKPALFKETFSKIKKHIFFNL